MIVQSLSISQIALAIFDLLWKFSVILLSGAGWGLMVGKRI
jgi:hypothetical protein